MKKKESIWPKMNELISLPNVSEAEKKLFLDAKKELDNGKNDEAIAATLKSQLSILSLQGNLSPEVVPFFTELSRLYLGYGRRDNITLNPMF